MTQEDTQADRSETVADLLHVAGETHHQVYRIVDGADDDWASWYADWLIRLSELHGLLGVTPSSTSRPNHTKEDRWTTRPA